LTFQSIIAILYRLKDGKPVREQTAPDTGATQRDRHIDLSGVLGLPPTRTVYQIRSLGLMITIEVHREYENKLETALTINAGPRQVIAEDDWPRSVGIWLMLGLKSRRKASSRMPYKR
jgi:hypothetical protein